MPPRNQVSLPIAMLHAIGVTKDASLQQWFISRQLFLQLLDVIEKANYQTTHFADLSTGAQPLTSSKLILSFDDCYKHLFDFAIPELVKRNMKAVFYMPAAHIGNYNVWDVERGSEKLELMNEADLRELGRLGMEVGSHSQNHVDLKTVDNTQLKKEVMASKGILENITGRPVYSFAYPYGSVPAGYKTILAEAGYRYAVAIYHPFENDFALRRFGVYGKDSMESLSRKFSRRYRWMRRVYDALKKYQ